MRGCTNSSVRSVHATVRRTSPSGSPCTVVAGPTGTTPRRRVGTTNSSSWARPAPSVGSANRAAVSPTGQLDEQRQQPAAGGVGDLDAAGGGVADGHPGGLDVDPDPHPRPPDGQRQAREDQHEARHRDHRQLGPGVAHGQPPRHQAHDEHGPAQRRHPPQHLDHRVPHRPGRLGDRPDPAAGEHRGCARRCGSAPSAPAPAAGWSCGYGCRRRPATDDGAHPRMPCRAVPAWATPPAVAARSTRRLGPRPPDDIRSRSDARVTVAPSSADDGTAAGARSERRVVEPTSSRGSVMRRGAPWGVPPRRGSG